MKKTISELVGSSELERMLAEHKAREGARTKHMVKQQSKKATTNKRRWPQCLSPKP